MLSWIRKRRSGLPGTTTAAEALPAIVPTSTRWGVAVGVVALAVLARLALQPVLHERAPFATMYLALLFSGWVGGFRTAIITLVLACVAVPAFIFQRDGWRFLSSQDARTNLGVFLSVGLITAFFAESMQSAHRRAAALAEDCATQREQLRTVLNSIADGVIVTDRAGRVVFQNDAARVMTGRGDDDALDRDLPEVFCLVDAVTHKPVASAGGAALRGESADRPAAPIALLRPDKVVLPIEERVSLVRDDKGQVGGAVLIFSDVSARRRAEEELRTSEALYRTLTEALPQMAWTAQSDGAREYVNRQWYEYTGAAPEETMDAKWMALVHADDRERVCKAWTQSVAGREPFSMDYRLRRHDGVYRWFLTRALPVLNSRGAIAKWVGTLTDIDEFKRTEESLKEADRRKNEFLAMLAHELRNPLAPIRHCLALLNHGRSEDDLRYARDVIARQVRQLSHLVDDLLDVSRITRGRVVLRRERLDVAEAVNSAVEASRPLIDSRRHQLTVALPPEPIHVLADMTRLSQIVANLVNNAAKYTGEGGQIWITVDRVADEARIRVRDTGIGIPREMLPRVFDLFTQVDRSLDRSEGGLGIGLTLVRKLVESHGGSVTAFSEGPGKGSEFEVRLPVAIGPGSASPQPRSPNGLAAVSEASRRVLIVDDHRDAAGSLAMLLEVRGHQVHLAHDGLAALEAARSFRPDVVLLDIGLPRLDGFEVARRLREELGLHDVLLIAVTGYGQVDDRDRSRRAGFDAHLVKPVDLDALFSLLARGSRRGVAAVS